jgi:dimethylhistidine N-methyltransferase
MRHRDIDPRVPASSRPAGDEPAVRHPASTFADDVQYYLTLHPRQLPSKYLYDALGSALFDAICLLPWYGVTRAELRLLSAHARQIFERSGAPTRIVELGPGNGSKLRALLQADEERPGNLEVHLVDVSARALIDAASALSTIPDVDVVTHQASYEAGLIALKQMLPASGRTLLLFLGSNIGNFDRPAAEAFLRSVRAALAPGDAFLMGADLVKPERELLLAYDDPLGVTAAFNRNLLVRINRELGGNFDINRFSHRADWNAEELRVEMHLVSDARQQVAVAAAGVEFTIDEGESIWTESSYKHEPDAIVERLEDAGFVAVAQWVDGTNGFALTLVRAV